jgi:syntaxin-binding protein 5
VAGGVPTTLPEKGLTFIDLGPTPVYQTSTWAALSDHFKVKKQNLLPTPAGAEIVDFCLVPRTSPHFAGAQDPIAIIALLSSGELVTLSFPNGHPISPTNQLHPSVTYVHPFVTLIAVSPLDRGRWLGMIEKRQQGPQLLRGGVEGIMNLRKYESRNIVQMVHGDGTVRLWDAGHGDEIENSATLQIDVARALDRYDDVNITTVSLGGTGEFAVGTSAGEVVIYRWGANKLYGRESPQPVRITKGGVSDVSARSEPTLKEGLQPFVLYDMSQGPISALKVSDVGFIGIGSENGTFSIIDLRGPAVIFNASVNEFSKSEKHGGFMKKSSVQSSGSDRPIVVEFGVMTLEGDSYSSIGCFVGTHAGKILTFKILPQQNGGYTAQFAGSTAFADKIISITPIVASSGNLALATGETVGALRSGQQTNGSLVVGKFASSSLYLSRESC